MILAQSRPAQTRDRGELANGGIRDGPCAATAVSLSAEAPSSTSASAVDFIICECPRNPAVRQVTNRTPKV
jgi:hypothetical protein